MCRWQTSERKQICHHHNEISIHRENFNIIIVSEVDFYRGENVKHLIINIRKTRLDILATFPH